MLTDSQVFLIVIAIAYVVAMAIVVYRHFKPQSQSHPTQSEKKHLQSENAPRLNFKSLKFHARYLPYVLITPLMIYFFYWSFIHDYVHWGKNIYQIIASQPHNIFYLWVCTLGLLVDCTIALIFFPRTKTVFFPRSKVPETPPPVKDPKPQKQDSAKQFGKFASKLLVKKETEK